jgi:hypothetical protein
MIDPFSTVEPFNEAEFGVSACVVLKKTPVRTSPGTSTSAVEVLVSVIVNVFPDRSKFALAESVPLEPVNNIPAHAGEAVAIPKAAANSVKAVMLASRFIGTMNCDSLPTESDTP